MKPAVILVSILFGVARVFFVGREFNPHIEQSYQAFAHLWTGGLLGAWLAWPKAEWIHNATLPEFRPSWLIGLFWLLVAVEVACAAWSFGLKA